MRKVLNAGPWLPDIAANDFDGLVLASGVYPIANGYRPLGSLDAVTTALTAFAGGAAFIGSDGTSALLAGDTAGLKRWTGSTWATEFAAANTGKWQFAQFGDTAIGVYGGAPVAYDLVGGTGALLGGTPPSARFITTAGNFVVIAGNDAENATVYWSGFNNAAQWTAGTNQSDNQPLPDGGKITGLAGNENYFLTFQRDAINRFSYIGVPGIFQRDKISTGVGCIAAGSIAQAGTQTFFLSERGFMMTDGQSVNPIGSEAVDQTFLDAYQRSELGNLTATVDPRKYLYILSMPGTPGRVWMYQWQLQRWSDANLNIKAVFQAFTSNISLDALDALYPGGIDTIPVSLDSALFQGGEPRLYGVTDGGVISTFTGPNMAATIEWPFSDIGQRARVFTSRPITDATDGLTVTIDAKARLGDTEKNSSGGLIRASGHVPVRANGRYTSPKIDIAAGTEWTYLQGIELEFGAGGGR